MTDHRLGLPGLRFGDLPRELRGGERAMLARPQLVRGPQDRHRVRPARGELAEERLGGHFRRRIHALRAKGGILGQRRAVGCPVDVRARRGDDGGARMLRKHRDQRRRSEDVHAHRAPRIPLRQRRHRQPREMDDDVRTGAAERGAQIVVPSDVAAMDGHVARDGREVRIRRILVREAVHLVTARDQVLGEMAAREAGEARDEHAARHRRIVLT